MIVIKGTDADTNIYNSNGTLSANRTLTLGSNTLTVSGSAGTAGVQYGGDYSANFTARSLVDLGYVDAHLVGADVSSTLAAPTSAQQGYSVTWDNTNSRFTLSDVSGSGGGGTGTVTSVTGTGTVSGITLSGTGTTDVTLTLGGTLSITESQISDFGDYLPLTGGSLTGDVDSTANIEAVEFIGDLRGAVLFKAQAGEALTKGEVVYISGISGNTTVVSKADADDANKMPAFGVVAADASLNTAVNIYTFGTLSNLNTSGYTLGDTLYVGTTPGSLVSTPPTGESSLIQNIAKVTRVDNAAGSIKVQGAGRTNATPNLNDGNVFIGNASNQAEARALVEADISDFGTYLTGNETITLSGDVSGSGTTSIVVTVADDSHNHVISNVDGLQTALDAKAPLASPALTGTPTAPTAATATNTTQIATTAFVKAQGYLTSFTEINDLTAAVTWANVPDANITESSVTQHQAALSITESQISDFGTYATLVGGKVPAGQLPSFVDDVVEAAGTANFPATGEADKIYVDTTTNKTYRWSGSQYVEISASPGSTDEVTEGSTNLYFTNARARAAISVSGSLSYDSGTGVISYTQPTNVSTFTNDSGYITASSTATLTNKSGNISQWTNDSGYLTSETSHADVVVDGDFASQGLMRRGATAGSYSIVTDNSTNWNTAFGWGDHSTAGYLTSETSHADVVVDGDFASQGLMRRGATAGSYSIVTDNSANWNTAFGWGDHAAAGYLTSFTETNDLTAAVTWANVPNANITEGSVTQHQAALSITESQISDLGTYSAVTSGAGVPSTTPAALGDIYIDTTNDDAYIAVGTASSADWEKSNDGGGGGGSGTVTSVSGTGTVSGISLSGTVTTSGSLTLGGTLAADTSNITTGTFADARIAQSNVTQHQAALSITESQISDLGAYITASSTDTLTNKSGNISQWTNDSGYTTNTGTVTSVGGTGTVNGLTLTGTVTTSGNLTLGGSVSGSLTGVTSVYNTALEVGRSSTTEYIDFGTSGQVSVFLANVEEFRFAAGGTFHADADVVAFSTTVASDERLKHAIEPIPFALEKVMSLTGVKFKYRRDNRKSAGVIAQNVEQVMPSAVREMEQLNSGETYKAVDYNQLIGLLIEGMKEQQSQINSLRAQLFALQRNQ